jgi:hypothetical protein
VRRIPLTDLLRDYVPGSGDWSWDEEERQLLNHECRCQYLTGGECHIRGHYQLELEAHLRALGRVEQGVCLGNDGRIWDGHHRIVAARRLGFLDVPVEDND